MEEINNLNRILELLPQPVFCVRNGQILSPNHAARQLFIEPGLPVDALLGDAVQDYAQFSGGTMYLQLTLPGIKLGASVTRVDELDFFIAERSDPELQALALASVQFRQPLSDVVSILSRTNLQLEPEYLAQLNRRLFQLQRMVFNMSDAARYAADVSPSRSSVDICWVVSELFEKISQLTERGGITLIRSCPREQIMTLLNTEKLERAVYNMVSNAMKTTPKGGTIEVSLTCKNKRLFLSVRDYGDGIPQDILGTVFTRYLRQPGLDSTREGLGLGMSLILSTATEHGGTVLIDRPKGGGTQVTMSLAIQRNPDSILRSDMLIFDYAGEQDHGLLELSDSLPLDAFFQD